MWWLGRGNILFWSNIFGVLQASCTFIGMLRNLVLGQFSSMILLKIFSMFLDWDYSPILLILRFDLFIVSQTSWMFCVRKFLDLTFYLTDASVSSIISTPEIFSSISCTVCDACVCSSCSLAYVPHFQDSLSLCFLYCFFIVSIFRS